jgi:hypothetical protein
MTGRRIIIACDILRSEMEYALKCSQKYQVEYIWLGAGLHNDLEALENGLEAAWEKIPENLRGTPEIRLMIGQGCLPHMTEWAAGKNVRLLPTQNCLTALLGEERLKELEQGRTMVITPSWLRRNWFAEEGIRSLLGWDNTDFRINFGRYDRILVLDSGLESLSDEEILEAFSVIEVPLEVASLSLEKFKKFFEEFLA